MSAVRLIASCEINFSAPAPVAAILMLRPRSGWGQWIFREEYDFTPRVPVMEYTDLLGNLCQRVVIPAGKTTLRTSCSAEISDAVDVDADAVLTPPEQLPEPVLHYLLPSRYCPSERLIPLANEITKNTPPGYAQVEAIRSWIRANIEYQYGTSTTETTAEDSVNDRKGVCRDFAHLGIT